MALRGIAKMLQGGARKYLGLPVAVVPRFRSFFNLPQKPFLPVYPIFLTF